MYTYFVRHRNTMLDCVHVPRSFLILMIFPSLIFSSISPTCTVTKVPTKIFVLSLSKLLSLVIVPTVIILVYLGGRGGVIRDCGSDYLLFFQITRVLRSNNSSIINLNHVRYQYPHSLTDQKQ